MRAVLLTVPVMLASMPAAAQSNPAPAAMSPAQAIAAAAEAGPEKGVQGVFEFAVANVGSGSTRNNQGERVYLNSEADYRSPANLSAEIMPATVKSLEQKQGGPLSASLVGKRVQVRGTVQQVRINEYSNGRKTGRYYFQTRILVRDAGQVVILP